MKLDIMGLQFDNVTMDEASARAEQILAGKKTCYAVTPNAEIAYEALYDETLRALINGADLVLPDGAGVVLAPKQELFMKNHLDELHIKLMIGLAGSLDSFAGTVKRAPKWMIRCNLEWLYRLIKEPKRFGRMLRLPKYLFAVLGKRIRG